MENSVSERKWFFVKDHVIDGYEEFARFNHPDRQAAKDFIQWAYNQESPYMKNMASLSDRLVEAARECAFTDPVVLRHLTMAEEEGERTEEAAQAEGYVKYVLDEMVSCYLSRIQNNLKFELYVSYQTAFAEFNQRLRHRIPLNVDEDKALKAMETKVKIMAPAHDLIKTIEQLRKDIFGDAKRPADVADKRVRKDPEYYARMSNKNK